MRSCALDATTNRSRHLVTLPGQFPNSVRKPIRAAWQLLNEDRNMRVVSTTWGLDLVIRSGRD